MKEFDKSNHGKVGEALFLKFTVDRLKQMGFDKHFKLHDGQTLSIEELGKIGTFAVPIHIDNNTRGNYECVCELGTEIH